MTQPRLRGTVDYVTEECLPVAMTNAQKQAAWRRRRDEQHQRLLAEIEELRNQSMPADREQELRAERAELRAKLAAQAGQALSGTAQQKLEAAMRAHRRKLELEFEGRVQAECKKRAEELSLPGYFKRMDEIKQMLSWPRNSVMTKSDYNTILRCLHPDGLNSRTEQQLAEAFRIFTHYKLKMVADDDERQKLMSGFPHTREELLARKKSRAKKSKAERSVAPV